jgi:hypothetical protein
MNFPWRKEVIAGLSKASWVIDGHTYSLKDVAINSNRLEAWVLSFSMTLPLNSPLGTYRCARSIDDSMSSMEFIEMVSNEVKETIFNLPNIAEEMRRSMEEGGDGVAFNHNHDRDENEPWMQAHRELYGDGEAWKK